MGAGVVRAQTIVSHKAAQTLSAYRVVKLSAANTVNYHDTTTAHIYGVTTQNSQGGSDTSVPVCIRGSAKVACAASISAGALVTAQSATASGLIMEIAAMVNNTTSAAVPKVLGIAMQSGSTNSVIEVMLQIVNPNKIAY